MRKFFKGHKILDMTKKTGWDDLKHHTDLKNIKKIEKNFTANKILNFILASNE